MSDQLMRALVRECIRRDNRTQERLLRECVRHLFEQLVPVQNLRTTIEQTLSDKSGALSFTAEQAPGTKSEVYARFISSDVRDTNMDTLATAIEADVLKAFPDAIVEKVNLSKHSRQVLRVQLGSDVVTVAFKGASAGGEGLEFEDALFAIIKTLPTITDMNLTRPEKKRLINSFGLGSELDNKEMIAALREVLEDAASLKPSIVSLLQRAEVSVAAIQKDPTFTALGDLSGVTLSGGAGGKADIVLKFGDQEIDVSLKHEKEKEGTNVFVFNKDLGDGTKEVTLGRNDPPALEQFKANLIPSPEPWWRTARKRVIDALKRTPGYNLTNTQEVAFVTEANPESLMAVKQLFIADKKAGGKASKVPSEVLREVGTTLQEQLTGLDPAQVLSIIEESQFGATSTNPLYKLTSSGAGTRLKPVDPSEAAKQNAQSGMAGMKVRVAKTRVAVPKAQRSDMWKASDTTESRSSFSVEIIGPEKNVLGSLIIMGVKFRTSIFATTKGGLSIKTRA